MKQREGSLKRYRLVETSVLTLVISRWHMTISKEQLRLLAESARHVAQGPLVVAGYGPFRGTAFVLKPHKRTLRTHEFGCSEKKG